MNDIERRTFLKGIVFAAVAAAVAPQVVPDILKSIPAVKSVPPAPQKLRAFIPVSTELIGDFPGLNGEIQHLLADAAEDVGRNGIRWEVRRYDPVELQHQVLFYAEEVA